ARRVPDRIAVRTAAGTLTHGELDARARAVAGALRARGVGAGDRVGLMTERDVHLLPAVLGALQAGATYVPLDPHFPAERLAFMIDDAKLAMVVTTAAVAERMSAAVGTTPVLKLDEPLAAAPDDPPAPVSA